MDIIFDKAFSFTIGAEIGGDWINGGYTNDPVDPGGETKFGISKRANPEEDIKNLSIERAKEIAYKNYWIPSNCDKLVSLGYSMTAIASFDASFNCGSITAKKFIQRVLGVQDDGIIGPRTLNNIMLYKDQDLCGKVIEERKNYYTNIISVNPKLKKFKDGWNNRLNNLRRFLNIE